jgi:hypothetical protein
LNLINETIEFFYNQNDILYHKAVLPQTSQGSAMLSDQEILQIACSTREANDEMLEMVCKVVGIIIKSTSAANYI